MTTMPANRHPCRYSLALAAILAVALLLRIAFAHHLRGQLPLFGDGSLYDYFARAVLDGHYPEDAAGFRSMMPPGYPAFVAAIYAFAGRSNYYAVRVVQCLLATATIYVLAQVASRLFNRRVALASAAVLAVYPYSIFYPATLMSETLFMFLAALDLLWLFELCERPSLRVAAQVGVVAGLAALTRPQHLLLLGIGLPWLLVTSKDATAAWSRRLAPLGMIVAGCALVVLPWTARNYRHYHEVVLISDNGTDVLWWGNNHLSSRMYLTKDRAEFNRLDAEIWGAEGERVLRRNGRTISQKKADVQALVIAYIRTHPSEWAQVEVRKLIAFWRPWLGGDNSRTQNAISLVTYGPILLLGLPFLVWCARRNPPNAAESKLLLLVCLMHSGLAVAFVALSRYRFAVIDPYLAIYACAAVNAAWRRRRSLQSPRRSEPEMVAS